IEPSWIGSVHDIDVVVAWQQQDPSREFRIFLHGAEELGPFGRAAGIRNIACDQDEIERLRGVNSIEAGQYPAQALIATRTRASALNAKPEALPDGMEIRQVCDAPRPACQRRSIEYGHVTRLSHRRISEPPNKGSPRKVRAHDYERVGECWHCET